MNAALDVKKISKIYGEPPNETIALKNVSLQIKEGEFVAIIGPSGSGKSTLMNILGLLDIPTSGEYFFENRKAANLSQNDLAKLRNQKIGFVFQSFNLLPRTTILKNVMLPMAYAGIDINTRHQVARKYIDRSIEIVKRAMDNSPFKIGDLQEVIMVGGQTRMPAIVSAVRDFFKKEPNLSINPDEVVALGAAVQAGQLQGDLGKEILLLDVTPLSLGLETLGGVCTKLITRNTTIPTSKTQVFSTAADNQPSVDIVVLQGEREMAADNKNLGRFMLDGIPPAPRGVPQVEVTFDIDANGIVNVSAKDKGTGKQQSIRIEASSGLSDDEIEKMKRDAEIHAEEDKKKREMIDVKNMADTMIYTTEKMMKDVEEKKIAITDEEKNKVEETLKAAKEAKDKDDLELIKKTSDELSKAAQVVGMKMYQQEEAKSKEQGASGANDAKASDEKKKDEGEAVEGEVVDEKK